MDLDRLPWFVPGVGLAAIASALASTGVSRALRVRRSSAFGLLLSLGLIAAATLTPLGGVEGRAALGRCDFSRVGFASPGDLLRFDDVTLNVLLFVPLGASIALLPPSFRLLGALALACVTPVAIEGAQLIVTTLGRGCESADVFDNLTGLFVGLFVVGSARVVMARFGPFARRPVDWRASVSRRRPDQR